MSRRGIVPQSAALLAFALVAASPAMLLAAEEQNSQSQEAEVQGRWEREEPPGSDASYKRATKEIKGNREVVTYYDADGKLVRQHKVDFKLSKAGDVNIFTYTNWEATEGPQKGTKLPGPVSYIYRVSDKQYREVWGFLPGQENRRTVLLVWKKAEGERDAAVAAAAGAAHAIDAKALAGTWEPLKNERGGEFEPEEQTKRHRLIFDGDRFRVTRDGETMIAGKYKVNTESKPAQIDMTIEESPQNPDDKGKVVLGLIEVTGDEMRWATGGPRSTERPKEFKSEAGSRDMVVTLRREKSK